MIGQLQLKSQIGPYPNIEGTVLGLPLTTIAEAISKLIIFNARVFSFCLYAFWVIGRLYKVDKDDSAHFELYPIFQRLETGP